MVEPINNSVYEYADLTDEEILELGARKQAEAAKEAEAEKKRWEKARSFRFVGGM